MARPCWRAPTSRIWVALEHHDWVRRAAELRRFEPDVAHPESVDVPQREVAILGGDLAAEELDQSGAVTSRSRPATQIDVVPSVNDLVVERDRVANADAQYTVADETVRNATIEDAVLIVGSVVEPESPPAELPDVDVLDREVRIRSVGLSNLDMQSVLSAIVAAGCDRRRGSPVRYDRPALDLLGWRPTIRNIASASWRARRR